MATAAGSNKLPQEEKDDLTSNEHLAMDMMMTFLENQILDWHSTDGYIDICAALDASPAFRRYKEERKIGYLAAADLLIAGMFYAELGGPTDLPQMFEKVQAFVQKRLLGSPA